MTIDNKDTTRRCRYQKTRQHKIAFETAALLNCLGMKLSEQRKARG